MFASPQIDNFEGIVAQGDYKKAFPFKVDRHVVNPSLDIRQRYGSFQAKGSFIFSVGPDHKKKEPSQQDCKAFSGPTLPRKSFIHLANLLFLEPLEKSHISLP
jgi:hypothetical protein